MSSCSLVKGFVRLGVETRRQLPQWKSQQKAPCAVVREETGRGKGRFKISELFADERCSKAILDFLATIDFLATAGSWTDSGPTGGGRGTRQPGLGVGEERTRGIPCTGCGGREGAGRGDGRLGGGYRLSFLSLFPFYFMSSIERRRRGDEEATS